MERKKMPAWASRLIYIALGLALVAGAIAILSRPGDTLTTMGLVLGLMALARGVAHIITVIRAGKDGDWRLRLLLALGLLLVILSIFLLFWPQMVSGLMVWAVALWFVVEAVRGFSWARRLRRRHRAPARLSLMLNALLLVCGVLMAVDPLPGLLTLRVLVGLGLLLAGADMALAGLLLPKER